MIIPILRIRNSKFSNDFLRALLHIPRLPMSLYSSPQVTFFFLGVELQEARSPQCQLVLSVSAFLKNETSLLVAKEGK